jgi:hypothetical protein
VALTHDARIRYKPNELAAVVQHGTTLLMIVGKATHADLAQSFLKTMPRVVAFLDAHRPPVIGKVYRPAPAELRRDSEAIGKVELWYPTSGAAHRR